MPAPAVANTVVGKIGNVYVVPYGTAAPFTIPPAATFDITAATLPAAWTAGNLGYIHEVDTPTFHFDLKTQDVAAWQSNGNPIRVLQTGKIRAVEFTVRELNKVVWGLVEPGSTYTAGAAGSNTVTVPNTAQTPDKAMLVELQDLDYGAKAWFYVPKVNVVTIGNIQVQRDDTASCKLNAQFLPATGLPTDPLYYIASNLPGMQ